jgi:2'-5' RNA ligase
MNSELHQAHRCIPPEDRLNVFALVIYIPDPLGRFLDDLRRELVPHDNPHAHVSVLPPRPLAVEWQRASEQVQTLARKWKPFEVELGGIEIFPVTNVIYIGLGSGEQELRQMHAAINRDALAFEEPFVYYPHITLAQGIAHEKVNDVHDLAVRRWSEFAGERRFSADHAVFVQNTLSQCWLDLAGYRFGQHPDGNAGLAKI